jgi:hypothetical protein
MRRWISLSLLLIALFLSGCEKSAVRATARSWLVKTQAEEPGFGMYSYLLFSVPPTEATKPLYLATIRSSVEMIQTKAREQSVFRRDQLNLYLIPVDANPPDITDSAKLSEWVLEHYFYPRAQQLLGLIPMHGIGPYLLSTVGRFPQLSATSLAPPYLLQNLTGVEPAIVPAWIGYFLRQSVKDEPWKESMGEKFALELRTYIESAAVQTKVAVPAMATAASWIKGKQ